MSASKILELQNRLLDLERRVEDLTQKLAIALRGSTTDSTTTWPFLGTLRRWLAPQ